MVGTQAEHGVAVAERVENIVGCKWSPQPSRALTERHKRRSAIQRAGRGPSVKVLNVILMLTACASSGRSPREAGPRIPQTIGEAQLTNLASPPRGAPGTMYRYEDGRFRADVVVYSKESAEDPAAQAAEFQRELKAMQLMLHEIDWYDVQMEAATEVAVGTQTFTGHHVFYRTTTRGRQKEGYFAVVALPAEYVKFMITHPPDQTNATRSRDFVSAWLTAYQTN